MKYVPPLGEAADAAYVDGNRSAGTKGSLVPAAAVEYPQREIDHAISFFGLTPVNADLQQLRKAIEAAIAAATGGGDTSQFFLISQARSRLKFFPEIESADGKMNVTSPSAGTVQVPTSVTFTHRGSYPVSTSDYIEDDRTFTTLANKTYHLRWTPVGGFALEDLADSGYNPSVLAENDAAFDSTYDDMLIARVVTSAGNVATITNLVNKDRLFAEERIEQTVTGPSVPGAYVVTATKTTNWARAPKVAGIRGNISANATNPAGALDSTSGYLSSYSKDRYSSTGTVTSDWTSSPSHTGLVGYVHFDLVA